MENVTSTKGKKLNFIDLFRKENCTVEIPIIQRDYAQGRANKAKLRATFLKDLKHSLVSSKALDLDFVYGTIDDNNRFIPLDGQQRLTTLFLLHWYLAQKEDKMNVFRTDLQRESVTNTAIANFSYETRISSREFCDALMGLDLDFTNLFPADKKSNNTISKTIKNENWYYLSWNNDPTISGMLRMLDDIHFYFKDTNGLFDRLTTTDNPLITFEFLDLPSFGLTDDLYIKMNARGKSLTDFENFKAQFVQFLEKKHPNLEKEFATKIDGIWCDLFWDFSVNHPLGATFKIDSQLLRYFDYITEILFYKDFGKTDLVYDFTDFELIEKVYTSVENITFLMQSFDLFCGQTTNNFKENINTFFEALFSVEQEDGKVWLFDSSINLLESLIYGSQYGRFDHFEKLMLFAVISYHLKANHKALNTSENLSDYLRVCRNFLLKINQKGNSGKKLQFVTDLRTRFYQDIIQTFNIVFDENAVYETLVSKENKFNFRKDNIKEEIYKAGLISNDKDRKSDIQKLEDHNYLKGDLHNFNGLISKDNLPSFTNLFYQVFENINDSSIVRSLLSIGDYSIWVGNCYFGGLRFFGQGNDWHRILTDKENTERLSNIFKDFFLKLINLPSAPISEKLEAIIEDGLKRKDIPTWQQLFIKYYDISERRNNLFAFPYDENERLDIQKLLYGTSLRSYHINPFILAVANAEFSFNKEKLKVIEQRGGEYSYIELKYSAYMKPFEDYWHINAKSQDYSKHQKAFDLEKEDGKNEYYLYPTKKRDFVEIAVDFINYIYQ